LSLSILRTVYCPTSRFASKQPLSSWRASAIGREIGETRISGGQSVSDAILEGVSVRAKDSWRRPVDANANQIGSSRLCHGRDGRRTSSRQTLASLCGDEVSARSRYIGSRCPTKALQRCRSKQRRRSRMTCRSSSITVPVPWRSCIFRPRNECSGGVRKIARLVRGLCFDRRTASGVGEKAVLRRGRCRMTRASCEMGSAHRSDVRRSRHVRLRRHR